VHAIGTVEWRLITLFLSKKAPGSSSPRTGLLARNMKKGQVRLTLRIMMHWLPLFILAGCMPMLTLTQTAHYRLYENVTLTPRGDETWTDTAIHIANGAIVELIRAFHKNLQNMPKVEALRQAQRTTIKSDSGLKARIESAWSRPFYRAPFILVGDWK
jgi:CHAT domain